MSRIQLALDVDDLDTAVAFYTRLLGTAPTNLRDGYASSCARRRPAPA